MKYTNELNLPEPLVNAIKRDYYDRGEGVDYTVTELIDPPRKIFLQRQHDHDIEIDVADEIYRILGQSIHTILERAGIPERRWAITILGKTISGKMDRIKNGLLQDWKVTSAYRFKDGKAPFEVEAQLNCYAEILRQNGVEVSRLEAIGILRDWSKLEALRDRDYPRHQVAVCEIKMWSREECVGYLESRVAAHEASRRLLPDCTREERWAKPEVWAVMRKDRKKAVRLLFTKELAEAFRSEQKDQAQMYLVRRPGENVRCQSYCSAAPFCEQWKKLQERS